MPEEAVCDDTARPDGRAGLPGVRRFTLTVDERLSFDRIWLEVRRVGRADCHPPDLLIEDDRRVADVETTIDPR